MQPPALPYDVLRYVFDKIPDEKTCLKQCSLVCRSWAFPAAHHLFCELTVDMYPPSKGSTLASATRVDRSAEICSDFLGTVRQSERIQSCLRKLVVHGNWFACDVIDVSWPDTVLAPQRSRCPLRTFQEIISALPRLQDLHLADIEFYSTPASESPESPKSSSVSRRSIAKLDVSSLRGQLGGILRSFSKIDALYVGRGSDLDKTPSGLPTVEVPALHFFGCQSSIWPTGYPDSETMIDTLCDVLDFHKLDHIELEQDRFTRYPEDIIRLLSKCRALNVLSVKCPDGAKGALIPESVVARCKLPPCPTLRLFRLWCVELAFGRHIPTASYGGWTYVPTPEAGWASMCAMLAAVPTDNSIAQMRLSINFDATQDLVRGGDRSGIKELIEDLDWEQLDRQLCRLDGVAKICFKVNENIWFGEELAFTMRAKLSEKARKRIVVKRHIDYATHSNLKEEHRRSAKSSMDAMNQYKGITVLRADAASYYQELSLS